MSPLRPLDGKVALITGGASGMGMADALLLAARGAVVAVTDNRYGALKAAQAQFDELYQVPEGVTRLGLFEVGRV